MKIVKLLLLFVTALISLNATAEPLEGQWQGNLQIGQQQVPIIFNVKKTTDTLTATMDSPLQGAVGIPVKSVELTGDKLVFNVAVAGARYESSFTDGKLIGTWRQSGQAFPLTMTKQQIKVASKKN